jgi:phosphoribosylformylglycinamidine synthase
MIHRIEVRAATDIDPLGNAVRQQIMEFGQDPGRVATSRIFLIDSDVTVQQMRRVAQQLLADPIAQTARLVGADDELPHIHAGYVEIHLKPGVMDPVAASAEMAIRDMGIAVRQVRTGRAYAFDAPMSRALLEQLATRVLANAVIESIHFEPWLPASFPEAHEAPFRLRTVPLRDLTESELKTLSRRGHLFLSLTEMQAIQSHYRSLARDPTDAELETLAQTWSEHCVHKTLKSAVDVEVHDQSGRVTQTRHYDNLIAATIFHSTQTLMEGASGGFCLSVFKDNAGVIAFDQTDGVCFKVETHNHPSAIEPYGGAATGVGGVIRDVLGTGLGARPIANTDVFCVAPPDHPADRLPRGVIHPRRVLQQVVAGVRDYGNRMGIPTVNGAVYFDERYVGNPLVFCGCVGLIPRDRIAKAARSGDAVVLMGGRTGRDGIHGATFSSAELSDSHADEFSHAVQIGNAITEKKLMDVILQARDRGLFNAITDCGAGGLSSAVGEMGEKLGASVELDKVPLKYAGLRYDEIWISEAQERMVLAVPPDRVSELLELAASEDVEATIIGQFGTEKRELVLTFSGTEVGRLSMEFLHHGLPMPRRRAIVRDVPESLPAGGGDDAPVKDRLLKLLAHPNIASKHWIIRQYDHEVQGGSVIKPLVGRLQTGPSDAAVIRPRFDSFRGVAIACGMAPHISDPYQMAIASIDEAIRNAVCVGAALGNMAMLDNFCWPGVDDEQTLGTLVRACEACRDAALAFGIPFISGKDSLNNQFTDARTGQVIRIPPTLLISTIGVIDDIRRCVTMDLKDPREGAIAMITHHAGAQLRELAGVHQAVATAISRGLISACHDVSEGGWLVAAAEMCIASGFGMTLNSADPGSAFDQPNATYLVELNAAAVDSLRELVETVGASLRMLGRTSPQPILEIHHLTPQRTHTIECHVSVEELGRVWRGTLDW